MFDFDLFVQVAKRTEFIRGEPFGSPFLLKKKYDDTNDNDEREGNKTTGVASKDPIIVNAPFTGAVGHLSVLRPGQCFEYMSGTDLATKKGVMKGHFYVAAVPPDTPSLKSGDNVDELLENFETFEATVEPFLLEAE